MKRKMNQKINFKVGCQRISTVSEEPVKSLGRSFDEPFEDINEAKEKSRILREGLQKINRCPLQGKFKVWCPQHIFIPVLLWPLPVYGIATSMVEPLETKKNKYNQKVLGLPPGLSDFVFCCRQVKLKLPFKPIVEEFKSGKLTPNDVVWLKAYCDEINKSK